MFRGLARSASLFEEAKLYIPGGVNSPVRAYQAVDLSPPFVEKGDGARIFDVDGNRYIDYVGSWGPLILGHRHPEVVAALRECLEIGTSFGAPTERETTLAKIIVEAFPAMEMVRMVNSGTEAAMSALRLARGYTGRDKIVKFEGCYHGHADHLLIKAGSGALTMGVPTSPGVPSGIGNLTITAPYNNIGVLEQIFAAEGNNIAAVIVEPVAGNMGCVPPEPGFLVGLRQLTQENGTILIFDEVMTGFRVAYGGAQVLYGIEPDLTCLGKIIGGGLPVGAYGGRRDIMAMVAPSGPVYQAGTLSGNPLAVTAGLATLRALQRPGAYATLEEKSALLETGLRVAAGSAGATVSFNRVGSMFSVFFTPERVIDYQSATAANLTFFKIFFQSMLQAGIYLAPSQFESGFMSLAHTDADIDFTVAAAAQAFAAVVAHENS